ncbi:MAG: histidinol-phosphate transaminase [Actinomycetes bacterium]
MSTANGPRLRAALGGIPAYRAGARPVARPGVTTFKLSSNENPYPPLPGVLDIAVRAAAGMANYPDPANTELVHALAERFGVATTEVVAGTGSVGLCQQLVQSTAGPGDEVLYAWRSFEAYPIITQIAGATSVQVPLTADLRHDLTAMAAAITERTRLIFICSPNNPTSTAVQRQELADFLTRVPDDVLVVIDEAYREFNTDPDVPDGMEFFHSRPNVAVLRTFSKAYGLAGLRVGFAIAREPVADALRATAVPFGVSVIAQAAAVASLAAEPQLLERVSALVAERERVVRAYRELGWDLVKSQANFIWLPLGARTGEFAAACEAVGVTVRPFANEGARITIGHSDANDRVIQVTTHFAS